MSDENNSRVTVTSENRAEFMAEKMGLTTESEVLAAEEKKPAELETETEEASLEPEDDTSGRLSKPNKLEKRFSEITRSRDAANERADRAEREIQELKAKTEVKPEPKKSNELIEPDRANYTDAFEYAKDLANFAAKNAIQQRDLQDRQIKIDVERQAIYSGWQKQLDLARSEIPDFDEILASTDAGVPDYLRDAIIESDVGAKILYHLAENPELAKKMADMSESKAMRELGKLEQQMEIPKESKSESVTKVSKAPQPIIPVKGGSKTDISSDDITDYKKFRELRKAGKIK